jgi:hypothetical protein
MKLITNNYKYNYFIICNVFVVAFFLIESSF